MSLRLFAACILVIVALPTAALRSPGPSPTSPTTGRSSVAGQPSLPVRAAFYYTWFPESWRRGPRLRTRYRPSLGFYDSNSARVIRQHIRAMEYAGIQVGISSWWGRGTRTDRRFPALLSGTGAARSRLRWAAYYEPEGQGDPTPGRIRADLAHIKAAHASDPAYFRLHGRPVVFVFADARDGCATAGRWRQAKALGFYVVLKVFRRYRACPAQPDGWHQYAPAVAADSQPGYAYSISPGFSKHGEAGPRLVRDRARWRRDIGAMVRSRAPFQLITTFNEWGEGTAVEGSASWSSPSGYGFYLDALHASARTAAAAARPRGPDPVVMAAGDIACGARSTGASCRDGATSDLMVRADPDAVLALGDIQYECGELSDFLRHYHRTWGRLKARTRPVPGNHEYTTSAKPANPCYRRRSGAPGYYRYFGAAASGPQRGCTWNCRGYYSWTLGNWHLIAINSNCGSRGSPTCATGSAQETWLRRDLARQPHSRCILAYWHHPRWSSGQHGSHAALNAIWNDLRRAGADVVLSGHDHDYERFGLLGFGRPGQIDPRPDRGGIRQFVVGTGGRNHWRFRRALTGSQVRDARTFGVLRLTLRAASYEWAFVPEAGRTFSDHGRTRCH